MIFVVLFYYSWLRERPRLYLSIRVHTLSVLVHTPEHVSVLIGNVYDSFIALVSPKIEILAKILKTIQIHNLWD